jgi:ElaB/YqjD/DUF883 family membrane-anchored ribosome-binding protein
MSITKNNVETLAADEAVVVESFKNVKEKASHLIDAASENIQEKAASVKKSVKKYLKAVDAESEVAQQNMVDFISEYPLASVGIALLSGVLLAKVFGK